MSGKPGRKWYPKRKVRCRECGWKGTRTTFMIHKKCPKCKAWGSMDVLKPPGGETT